jgi:TPR repeat protein
LSSDQGNAFGQCYYGLCLRDGTGISKDLKGAAHYFKLSSDQGNVEGQCQWGMCLLTGKIAQRNLTKAIQERIRSVSEGSAEGRAIAGWMTENSIRIF